MEIVRLSTRSNKRLTKATITVLITVVIFFAAAMVLLHFFGVSCDGKYKIDRCYIISKYSTGITRYSVNNRFETLNEGDTASITFEVPQGIYTIFPNPVLRIDYYNCAIKVYDEHNKMIYSDGWKDVAREVPESFIGNSTCTIPIFTKSYNLSGQTVKIYLQSTIDRSTSQFDAYIVRSNDAWKVPIDGYQALFVLLTAFIVVSCLLALYSIMKSIMNKTLDMGVSIFLTVFSFAIWSMGSQRMIGVIIQDIDICARVEYFALYVLSVSIALFGFSFFKNRALRKAWGIILGLVSAFFVTVCLIQMITYTITVQRFMVPLMIIMIAEVIFIAVGANVDREIRGAVSTVIMRCGVLVMAIVALLEIGRYLLLYIPEASSITKYHTGSYAAVVLTGIMMTYYIILTLEAQTSIIERQQLEEIAYKDTLTGIPNRSFFNRQMDEMTDSEQKEYTMFFMDLNDLKKANDEYGHSMGDRLIIAAAECMTRAFGSRGIYCRWGGDEFVAFVPGPEKTGKECVEIFKDSIEELNKKEEFPFTVTAAIGEVRSDISDPIDPNSAIREADMRMYATKKTMKASAKEQ